MDGTLGVIKWPVILPSNDQVDRRGVPRPGRTPGWAGTGETMKSPQSNPQKSPLVGAWRGIGSGLDFLSLNPIRGTWWEVESIDVETGCLRILVCGLLQVSHIGEVAAFKDLNDAEYDPDTFYNESEMVG